MCAVAPSREWRLPWEKAQAPFRPFTNIWQVEGDACRALPDSCEVKRAGWPGLTERERAKGEQGFARRYMVRAATMIFKGFSPSTLI
jgi:hypothetical protein